MPRFYLLTIKYRYLDGTFFGLGIGSWYWSSTEFDTNNAWDRDLVYYEERLGIANNDKNIGFSVRCIRD